MITVTKIDFQGDDLFIQYRKPEDIERQIKFRMIVVAWKSNPDVMNLLNRLFNAVVTKYVTGEEDKETINWDEFLADLKRYEEKSK